MRNAKIVRQDVASPHGDHPEGGAGARQSLQRVVDGAIAAGDDHGVVSAGEDLAHLGGSCPRTVGRVDENLFSVAAQDGSRLFHDVASPVHVAS